MPPRIPVNAAGYPRFWRPVSGRSFSSFCVTCRSATRPDSRRFVAHLMPSTSRQTLRPRKLSNLPGGHNVDNQLVVPDSLEYISKLKVALVNLQRHFPSYVNLSRLQLALRGLEQKQGAETIRVAVLGLQGQVQTPWKVRELVRLLFADPLREEEEWERLLIREQTPGAPFLLRIGEHDPDEADSATKRRLLREFTVSSPTLNGHRLEILVLETCGLTDFAAGQDDLDAMLVPNVEILTSSTGRYTTVTTPVHKALVLGDGIMGAASLVKLSGAIDSDDIMSIVDLPGYSSEHKDEAPFQIVDVALARTALLSFRKSLDNAMIFEQSWFKSGVPELLDWLKDGTAYRAQGPMKTPIRSLLVSLLEDASRRVQREEAAKNSVLLASTVSFPVLESLRCDLKVWAENAHTELRDQLDIAFEGKRWRKIGWWKLFWRVDDVSMITTDILNQRFLLETEKEVIYLAGKVEESGLVRRCSTTTEKNNWAPKNVTQELGPTALGPTSSSPFQVITETPEDSLVPFLKPQPWPQHIPSTRTYLSTQTVPALQALAQKLVVQALTTSCLTSTFAGLIYVSSISTTLFEVGAVAAFGLVWSLGRMQKKWEAAREFWEKEVREEGRKSIRAVESVMSEALIEPKDVAIEGAEELEQARKAVEYAKDAFDRATGESSR